jgi:hypothetical protein
MVEFTKKWTWEELKQLREMVDKGWSASAIATTMRRTRNAVIGVCNRNNIQLQNKNGKMMAAEKARMPPKPKKVRPIREKLKDIKPFLEPLPKVYIIKRITPVEDVNFIPLNKKITELRHADCRAVMSEITMGDTLYCAHGVVPGKSWCPYHMMKYTYPIVKRSI